MTWRWFFVWETLLTSLLSTFCYLWSSTVCLTSGSFFRSLLGRYLVPNLRKLLTILQWVSNYFFEPKYRNISQPIITQICREREYTNIWKLLFCVSKFLLRYSQPTANLVCSSVSAYIRLSGRGDSWQSRRGDTWQSRRGNIWLSGGGNTWNHIIANRLSNWSN